MAKKIGVCPNCKEVIIVNADKKLDICSLCKEPYITNEAINGDVPSNKKLGVCPSCNKEIIVKKPDRMYSVPFKTEINLIGQTVDEALYNLQYFIDGALLNNVSEVRIIHGVGLKKLSTAIHGYLKTLNCVDSFRFGKYGEGENGVTIVTFK